MVFPGDGVKAPGIVAEKKAGEEKAETAGKKPDQAAEADSPETHVVRKGDTLGKIAKKYGTTVGELCRANRITAKTTLRIGQRIRIP